MGLDIDQPRLLETYIVALSDKFKEGNLAEHIDTEILEALILILKNEIERREVIIH